MFKKLFYRLTALVLAIGLLPLLAFAQMGGGISNPNYWRKAGNDVILIGSWNLSLDGYEDMTEISAPSNPAANDGRLYVVDDGGTTELHFLDSAGTDTDIVGGIAGAATRALDNLASVAINTSLVSDTAATDNLGTEALYWLKLFLGSEISFEGSTDDDYQTTFSITDPTSTDKTITFQDASGIVAMDTTAVTDLEGDKLSITTGTLNVTETDSVVGAVTGIIKADGGGNISAAVADTDYQQAVTWGDGVEYSAPTASIDYNATNLKITATELNTIQDIDSTASPSFTGLTLSGLNTANGVVQTDGSGVLSTSLTPSGLTSISASTLTDGTASMSGGAITGLTTPLTVAQGGTSKSSWTQYLIPYADTTTSFSQIAIGTAGQLLTSAGAGSAPSFATYTGDSNLVTVGALNSGSITSGFGTIDTGSSTIDTDGKITGGALDVGINGTISGIVTWIASDNDQVTATINTSDNLAFAGATGEYTFDNNIGATGTIYTADAAGGAILNEAATTTNPTLVPNRAENDTGIGWASDVIHIDLGGVSEYNFSTTALSMDTNDITLTGAIGRDTDNEINWGTDDSLALVIGGVTHNVVSISDGTGDNDKLVTQGYVDDAVSGVAGFATQALDNLSSVAINTDLISDTADTDSLGSTDKEWLNAYIGDAGKLYFGLGQDADIARTAANELTITATSGTKISTDLILAATNDLYLDGGTDTYITESSADVFDVYVGGVDALQLTEATTITAVFAASSDIQIGDGSHITLDQAPASDDTGTGITGTVTVDTNAYGVGACLTIAADGNYDTSDADADTSMPCEAMALETGTGSKKVMFYGVVRNDTWNWSMGAGDANLLYVSTTTGELTQTAPSGASDQVQVVGWALSDDEIFFAPDLTLVEISA